MLRFRESNFASLVLDAHSLGASRAAQVPRTAAREPALLGPRARIAPRVAELRSRRRRPRLPQASVCRKAYQVVLRRQIYFKAFC